MTDTPLTDQRLTAIRQGQPTEWLPNPWKIHQLGDDSWQVLHGDTVIAALPDWAGNLALWMANAPEDIRDLLAEVDRLRKRNAELESADWKMDPRMQARFRKRAQQWGAACLLVEELRGRGYDDEHLDTDAMAEALGLNEE